MIIAIIALVLSLISSGNSEQPVMIVPANAGPHDFYEDGVFAHCLCDECCYDTAVSEYADEFTALFNSYEVKRTKNNRLMIRSGNSGSFKFVKKG